MKDELLFAAAEAILFQAGDPVEAKTLAQALNLEIPMAVSLMLDLKRAYEDRASGLIIVQTGTAFQLCTSPHVFEFLRAALARSEPVTLSAAAVETLAIVAYKQPVTRSEIEQIRGVQSSSSLDLLVARGLVSEAGKLDLPGRPIGFITTGEFLKLMKMDSLASLPSYEQFSAGAEKALEDAASQQLLINREESGMQEEAKGMENTLISNMDSAGDIDESAKIVAKDTFVIEKMNNDDDDGEKKE